jgi:hypothetical protein
VSWAAVKNFIHQAAKGLVKIHKRATKKSGKEDKETEWAKARLAQAQQLKQQFANNNAAVPGSVADLPPLHFDGIAWWVEFDLKMRLGHTSKWETILCRHPDTGEACSEVDGGVWDAERPTTSMKYPGEGRVCAGALMWKADEDDTDNGKPRYPVRGQDRRRFPGDLPGPRLPWFR